MGEKPVRTQRWSLTVDGHAHRVQAVDRGLGRAVEWWVDDVLVATRRSSDEKLTLHPGDGLEEPVEPVERTGTLQVRFSLLGRGRRATWHDGPVAAPGGGVDLEPEAGSPAAYEERVRLHPRRYAVQAVVVSVLTVVLPLLLGLMAFRFAFSLPWPDLPSLPLPDLPDLPSLPLPDVSLPDWTLPGWVRRVLDVLGYVWPVALAFVLARAEIRRRRRQDELRAARSHDGVEERD